MACVLDSRGICKMKNGAPDNYIGPSGVIPIDSSYDRSVKIRIGNYAIK